LRHDLSNADTECLQLHLGGDRNFCYLLGDRATGRVAAVDPGFEPEAFAAAAAEAGLTIAQILITQGHGDHTGGAEALARATGAPVWAGRPAAVPGAQPLVDGQVVAVGGQEITALATPGHAPDHYCFLCGGFLVTGDLLFCGKVGGTGSYFPGSDARQEWDSLQRILQLPPATVVLPGHDYYGGEGVMPHSTLAHERDHNPFLNAGGFAGFVDLKANWAAYKQEHGIR